MVSLSVCPMKISLLVKIGAEFQGFQSVNLVLSWMTDFGVESQFWRTRLNNSTAEL